MGLDLSTGDYIYFMDPDDTITNDFFCKMTKMLDDNNIDCVFCGFSNILNDNRIQMIPDKILLNELDIVKSIFDGKYFSAVWNKMFKRKLLMRDNKFIYFDTSIKIGEDFLWLVEVLKNYKKTKCIKESLYNWYRHSNSAVGLDVGKRLDNAAMTEIKALKKIVEILSFNKECQHIAVCRLFGLMCVKFKQSFRNNIIVDNLKDDFKYVIKKYRIKSYKDFLKKTYWKIVIRLSDIKIARKLVLLMIK